MVLVHVNEMDTKGVLVSEGNVLLNSTAAACFNDGNPAPKRLKHSLSSPYDSIRRQTSGDCKRDSQSQSA